MLVAGAFAVALGSALGAPQAAAAPSGAASLPAHLAPAAYRAEPPLPAPASWPFSDAFPRTSGTGRRSGDALFWTDFLYDDHGTTGVPVSPGASVGTPSFGTYTYPEPAAHNDGADLFRVAVGIDADATWWRVDWVTLTDPDVPLAVWTIDADGSSATGVSDWPAGAGVHSPGIDHAIVVSSRSATLVDLVAGTSTPLATTEVDAGARSFLVRVPRATLAPTGTWTVRVAAGLADPSGAAMLALDPTHGALPGQPAVYNVGFRGIDQELPTDNFAMDMAQTSALLTGDVSSFAAAVDWAALEAGASDPEPSPRGFSNRWYVSSVEPGDGVVTGAAEVADGKANYLGRVQPYAVDVPDSWDGSSPLPLTWLLHSLTQNHNQYGATTPKLLKQACQDRGSLCATTLGRGPDGDFMDVAELDFWEVWHALSTSYPLDPERTAIGGYSMGGFGTTRFITRHPDAFAAAIVLAGAGGRDPLLVNLRWVPTYIANGALDELVPVKDAIDMAAQLDEQGYRYRFDLLPAADHVTYELSDGFSEAAAYLGSSVRTRAPALFTFAWDPADHDDQLGIAVGGAYWVDGLVARSGATSARVDALSAALPSPAVTAVRTQRLLVPGDPSPAVVQELTWTAGASPALRADAALELMAVDALTLDLPAAGLGGTGAAIAVGTDGTTRVGLRGAPVGAAVTLDGAPVGVVSELVTVVAVPVGEHTIAFGSSAATADVPRVAVVGRLPATGGGGVPVLAFVLLAAALAAHRRLASSR